MSRATNSSASSSTGASPSPARGRIVTVPASGLYHRRSRLTGARRKITEPLTIASECRSARIFWARNRRLPPGRYSGTSHQLVSHSIPYPF